MDDRLATGQNPTQQQQWKAKQQMVPELADPLSNNIVIIVSSSSKQKQRIKVTVVEDREI